MNTVYQNGYTTGKPGFTEWTATLIQVASGVKTTQGMSGNQWANVNSLDETNIEREFEWDDHGDGEWSPTFIHVKFLTDKDSDLGYDVTGPLSQQNLSGTKSQYVSLTDYETLNQTVDGTDAANLDSTYIATAGSTSTMRDSHTLDGPFTEAILDSEIVITGDEHDYAEVESFSDFSMVFEIGDDGEGVYSGTMFTHNHDNSDVGRNGSAPFTRETADTVFTGTAILRDGVIHEQSVDLNFTLSSGGQWQLGGPDAGPSLGRVFVEATDFYSENATGIVAGGTVIDWTGTASQTDWTDGFYTSTIISIPTEVGSGSGATGSGGVGSDGGKDHSGDDQPSLGEFPELQWDSSGTGTSTLNAVVGFKRNATGSLNGAVLSGTAVQNIDAESKFNRVVTFEYVEGGGNPSSAGSGTDQSGQDDSGADDSSAGRWETVSGTGGIVGHVDGDFSFNGTGTLNLADFSGAINVGGSGLIEDRTLRTDTLDVATDQWLMSGYWTEQHEWRSDGDYDLNGVVGSNDGLSVEVDVNLNGDSMNFNRQETRKEWQQDADANDSGGKNGGWEIVSGLQVEEREVRDDTTADALETRSVTAANAVLSYEIAVDDHTKSYDRKYIVRDYDTEIMGWGDEVGYTDVYREVKNFHVINGTGNVTVAVIGGSGSGTILHNSHSKQESKYHDVHLINGGGDRLITVPEGGDFHRSHDYANNISVLGTGTFMLQSGHAAGESGTFSFGTSLGGSSGYNAGLKRAPGVFIWNDRVGSAYVHNHSEDEFSSEISGVFKIPAGGNLEEATGTFESKRRDNQYLGVKRDSPIGDTGLTFDQTDHKVFDVDSYTSYKGKVKYRHYSDGGKIEMKGKIDFSGSDLEVHLFAQEEPGGDAKEDSQGNVKINGKTKTVHKRLMKAIGSGVNGTSNGKENFIQGRRLESTVDHVLQDGNWVPANSHIVHHDLVEHLSEYTHAQSQQGVSPPSSPSISGGHDYDTVEWRTSLSVFDKFYYLYDRTRTEQIDHLLDQSDVEFTGDWDEKWATHHRESTEQDITGHGPSGSEFLLTKSRLELSSDSLGSTPDGFHQDDGSRKGIWNFSGNLDVDLDGQDYLDLPYSVEIESTDANAVVPVPYYRPIVLSPPYAPKPDGLATAGPGEVKTQLEQTIEELAGNATAETEDVIVSVDAIVAQDEQQAPGGAVAPVAPEGLSGEAGMLVEQMAGIAEDAASKELSESEVNSNSSDDGNQMGGRGDFCVRWPSSCGVVVTEPDYPEMPSSWINDAASFFGGNARGHGDASFDFVTGLGDHASFGLGPGLRYLTGVDHTNYESTAYEAGGWAGVVIDTIFIIKGVTQGLGRYGLRKLTQESAEAGVAPRGTFDLSQSVGAARVSSWGSRLEGTRLKQVGNYWIKEVDPNASAFRQLWGRGSLNAQARALDRLGDLAPSHLFSNGKLIIRDVGEFAGTRGDFWRTWAQGSVRLRTPFNDIRVRNIGANGQVFDPALHPIQQAIYWGGSGLIIYKGGELIYVLAGGEE